MKQLVRNVIDPARDLGHVDRDHKKEKKDMSGHEGVPAAREGEEGGRKMNRGDLGQEGRAEHSGAIEKFLDDDAAADSTGHTSEDEPKKKHGDAGKIKDECEDCA